MSSEVKRYSLNEFAEPYTYPVGPGSYVSTEDYDALHAEAEALRAENGRLREEHDKAWRHAGVNAENVAALSSQLEAARTEIEELDALRNRQSELLSQTAIALRGPEPALTRYSHADIPSRVKTVVSELEAAQGLLELCHAELNEPADSGFEMSLRRRVGAFLTATQAPEVPAGGPYASVADALAQRYPKPSLLKDCNVTYSNSSRPLAEQGERQEAACWVPRACLDKLRNGCNNSPAVLTDGPAEFNDTPLYTTPQPAPDVRGLVEALEECAASLAWNCFGECRAIHAGPIMPAAMALDTARAALAAHRQAQSKGDSHDR